MSRSSCTQLCATVWFDQQARDGQSSSPVNPLAERAWQLQQQLQQLQALQVMQSQQHAAAGSQRSSFDGRSSIDGGSVGVPPSQAGAVRQALVQQQLQAQVLLSCVVLLLRLMAAPNKHGQ